jgi:hypothetical protein
MLETEGNSIALNALSSYYTSRHLRNVGWRDAHPAHDAGGGPVDVAPNIAII